MKKVTITRVAIYVRVSTDEQAKEGFSIPAQRERLRAFCQSQGWEIIEEYVEEGWSAKDIQRPQMQRLLKDIKKGTLDMVLVYRLDRLTRSVLDLYLLLQIFEKHDVAFRSATEVYDTSTAMGRLFITLVAALAQWERENLAERVKFGIEQMIDQGKKPGGHSPFGYHFDKDFTCTIIEQEARVVEKIYQWYAEGFGYRSIAKQLNEMDVSPRIAKRWNHISVRDILLNDMYIGVYRWGNKIVLDNHPPIISKQLFAKVKKTMEGKSGQSPRKGKFPLTGILRCGDCEEHNMQGFYDHRDQKTYYRCLGCNRVTHDQRILDPLLGEIERLITSKEYFLEKVNNQREVQVDLDKIRGEIAKIQTQKEKWYDVFMDDSNPIPKETLFEKINALNNKENELQELINDYDAEEETPEEKYHKIKKMTNIREQYHLADVFRKKELLHSLFEKVIIYRERGRNKKIRIEYSMH
ncbi:recombinase family protein [Brevibacillus laterosporus]|uniref:recombinase family protein n=1 Tax=Brevibacillus laterosporus TaxID=1465 RepID=UPI0026558FC3|nr:recombinase family protein [Brevibacillus laterosporus]MDN9009858.1 recombinase family protein [Brevibacillus laterosporus]MDO0940760.1 recombinase family protein [Brevibacillus laterosporus]